MAAPALNSLTVPDWHSAFNPIEDAELERLAEVVRSAVSSVDTHKGAGCRMDPTAARVLFYATLPFPWSDEEARSARLQ